MFHLFLPNPLFPALRYEGHFDSTFFPDKFLVLPLGLHSLLYVYVGGGLQEALTCHVVFVCTCIIRQIAK